jgi:DeoR/GlpR family transcriptional regulator of sugar metabolism
MKKETPPTDRQDHITQFVLERGSVTVDDLVDLFGVSRMTIHRDLDELESLGVLRKVRNGATAQPSNLFESDYRYRNTKQLAEKVAVCRLAIKYIEPGQSIIVDDSTTVLQIAKFLPEVGPLTVVSSFLPFILAFANQKNIRLIALGGEYQPHFETFTGLICQKAVSGLHADICLLSAPAYKNGVLYSPEPDSIAIKRVMMAQSTQKFLLLDHTKFHRSALHYFASVSEFDHVIVDAGIAREDLDDMHARDAKVEVAEM